MDKNIINQGEFIKLAGNDRLRIKGRYSVKDDMLAFDWSNSGFSFAFFGTGFCISLGRYGADIPAYVKIVIDGSRRQRFAVVNGSEMLIVEGLSEKRHRVDVLRVTEGEDPLLFDSISLFGQNAAFRNPPFNSPRRIEFVGDSITCGYGVLGNSSHPTYQTYQQDSTYSYAYLTAEKFGADSRHISISGKGIVCNCEGNREDVKTGEYCNWLTRKGGEVTDGWQPQVVVINIGTNDSGGPASFEEFSEAGRELVAKHRAKYPDADIIWLYGMMNGYYCDTLKNLIKDINKNDPKVHFVFVDNIADNPSEIGANGHPNVHASVRVSNILFKKIRALTGWKKASPKDVEE